MNVQAANVRSVLHRAFDSARSYLSNIQFTTQNVALAALALLVVSIPVILIHYCLRSRLREDGLRTPASARNVETVQPIVAPQRVGTRLDIRQIVGLARVFEAQIHEATRGICGLVGTESFVDVSKDKQVVHEQFYFPLAKWEAMMNGDIDASQTEECRLDLIEALAEYNFPETRPVLDDLTVPPEYPASVRSILEEAKNTFKGQVWVMGALGYQGEPGIHSVRNAGPSSNPVGPYAAVHLTYRTNQDGADKKNRNTLAFLGGKFFHVDLFLTVEQDGRLILPAAEGRQQAILRCSDWIQPLECRLIDRVWQGLNHESQYADRNMFVQRKAARDAALAKMEKARGAAFFMPFLTAYQNWDSVEEHRRGEARWEALQVIGRPWRRKPLPDDFPIRGKREYQLRQTISWVMKFVKIFDRQIQALGAETLIERTTIAPGEPRGEPIVPKIYKFSFPKWKKVIADSYKNGFRSDVMQECRLDLLKALAEYNVSEAQSRPGSASSSRAVSRRFLNSLVQPLECPKGFGTILEDAKKHALTLL